MEQKIKIIVEKLQSRISEKYQLIELKLFGSSARGDNRADSDIDVWVCLPELNRAIEEDLFDIAYDMELEYDCLIDLIAVSVEDIKGRIGATPIYDKILREGVSI